jgi:hypothetical protein
MTRFAFARDKLMNVASRRREDVSSLLRANVAENGDEVIGSVLVDDTSAEWLCDDEHDRWRHEIIEHRNNAMAWTVFSLLPAAAVAGAGMTLAWLGSIGAVIAALAALALFVPILGFTLRMACADIVACISLRRRGHSEISPHILEVFGGSVWILGRKGLYFTCKPTPRKEDDRKINCIPYSSLGTPRISHFFDSAILELTSWDGWLIAQLVFDGESRSKAQEAALAICRCLGGPPPPGPRKRTRPPTKPGSGDPGFSLPAMQLYSGQRQAWRETWTSSQKPSTLHRKWHVSRASISAAAS